MFLLLNGWVVIFIISLLVSLVGINQGVLFFWLYTIPLICSYLALLITCEALRPLSKKIVNKERKNIGFSALRTIGAYVAAFVISFAISNWWFNISFFNCFEAITFVIALFLNLK